MDKVLIIKSIKDGIKNGYEENLEFFYDFNRLQNSIREYLLTVNIAQALKLNNSVNLYYINLEYPLIKFYDNAFPSTIIACENNENAPLSIFNTKIISRKKHSPTKNQSKKIDIVITKDCSKSIWGGKSSYAGIEVKGININPQLIKIDINRLVKAMVETDTIAENSIELSAVCFLKCYINKRKYTDKEQIENNTKNIELTWNKTLTQYKQDYPSLSFEFLTFDIASYASEDIPIADEDPRYASYDYNPEESGNVLGGIIVIAQKDK